MSTNGEAKRRERVAVIGYDEEGRAHARNLRDHGHDVVVAMLPGGMSWVTAVRDGFRPVRAWEAARGADVIAMILPESEQELVYWEEIAPVAEPGSMLVFTHGCHLDTDQFPTDVDVASVELQSEGACLVTVHKDATGRARARAFAYADSIGHCAPRSAESRTRLISGSDPYPNWRKVL
jgi:ketol-acid reductoisomerase